jgi:uncharacterized protein YjbI with pentapeptide repeats
MSGTIFGGAEFSKLDLSELTLAGIEFTHLKLVVRAELGVLIASSNLIQCDLSEMPADVFRSCFIRDCVMPSGELREGNYVVREGEQQA